jgi:hypothetical protein
LNEQEGIASMIKKFTIEFCAYMGEVSTSQAIKANERPGGNVDFTYGANVCHLYATYMTEGWGRDPEENSVYVCHAE